MPFLPLRRLLTGAAQRAGITRDLAITEALHACQSELARIFGRGYSKFAEPIAMRPDGTIIIACRSPAVAQTIRLHESELLREVRRRVRGLTAVRVHLIPRSRDDLRTLP